MSDREDNPFARWSRLKQAARKAEVPSPEEAEDAGAAEDARGDLHDQTLDSPDAVEPAEPLPRLEDLTAESDLTAFLRKGVPSGLRNTALRKMWSLDPVIRDYVGPAEYAWDFNKPGSMPGFGPLEAGKAVADFLSKVASSDPQDSVAEPQPTPPSGETVAAPDQPTEAFEPEDLPETPEPDHSPSEVTKAEATEKPAPAGSHGASGRPRHGSALPR